MTVSVTGTEFQVVDSTGTNYLIYAFSSITFTTNAQALTATKTYTGIIRMAMLAQPGHKALLDQYSSVYPTSFSLDYNYPSATQANLIFNWQTSGSGSNLLMLTWPHHRLKLQNANYPPQSSLSYLTTKVRSPASCS
jgi:endo-1,3(4)-beta-glucanase